MKNASSSSPTENLLIEEREEVMVTKKGRCLRKTHFLKPFLTSIKGGSVAELPRRHYQRPSDFSSDLKRFSSQVSFSGFWFAERRFLSWVVKMEALHAHTWKKAGIFDAIKASTYKISKNTSLILSVTEKWCPETKSFVFPWGEATITLEDVMVLLGFSVLGSPIFAPLKSSEMRDAVEKLDKARFESRCRDSYVSVKSWISSFSGSGGQMEHEAFLVLWLSLFVFPSTARRSVSKYVTSIAVRLARGERIALAPVVLSILYRDLGRICDFSRDKSDDKIYIKSLFKLVQVWIWERFRNTRPKAREIPKGEPRIAQWGGLPQRSKTRLRFDDFEWRPYTKPLKNWNPLRFYLEEAMWVTVDDSVDDDEFVSFARCVTVSQLVGDGFLEDYFPNRVAMQFGLAQDLPALVTRRRNFTEKEAWNDYSKSLDGLKLYMPCRLDRGSVTTRYRVWWLKSVARFLGSAEMQKETIDTFDARKKSDHDDDASPKVLPLSHVVQKLEEGFSAKRRRSRLHRLVKQDKIGVLVKSRVSSGRKMNKKSKDFTNKRSNNKRVQKKRAHEDDDESSMDEEDDKINIDVSPEVLSLSVVQKLEEGFSTRRRSPRIQRLVKQDKIGGLVNSRVSSGWKMNKTSEDFTNKRSVNKPVQLQQSIYQPVQLQQSMYKPVQLQPSMYKPVQLQKSIYDPVQLKENIYIPVQMKKRLYKPVHLQQRINKPVQLQQSIYNPVQLQQSTCEPVQLKQSICEPMQLKQSICEPMQLKQSICEPMQLKQSICEPMQLKQSICEPMQLKQSICEPMQLKQSICEPMQLKQSICEPMQLKQSICEPMQLKQSICEPMQLKQSICEPMQLKQSICEQVQLKENIYIPVQMKKRLYKPVHLQQRINKPVQLQQSIYNPVQLQQSICEPVQQSICQPVQLKRANEDEEDDNITIARWIESRKKYSSDAEIIVGDASETLGKRTRRYLAADSDDGSEPCKKYASTRVEQRREKDDETANKSQKTREILNGFDADVIGNNEGKKNMIDGEQHNGLILQSIGRDGSKKAECLVHEDGEKQRCNDEKLCSEVKKEEELDERLKQRRLAVKEIELKLEARMVKVKKTLAKIIVWKTRGNTNHNI
ncbi:PREDICTED: uncharacterized protein LOC104758384 isoform X1 [Camelina sativa]|uniref:Uncharacterized protein LOC104758384 isoform X1 n=1 Tax=Camelina sativa TaxID=90675 RepID=A0ABM1R6K2_CAMSA|nr:PREDICTED: uncharacterized protein LOC104758384 isoform X1 [Camelina sativa]